MGIKFTIFAHLLAVNALEQTQKRNLLLLANGAAGNLLHGLTVNRVSVICKECQKPFSIRQHEISLLNRKFCSKQCADTHHGKNMRGANSPNWKGGITALFGNWRGDNWSSQSRKARLRDQCICQSCFKPGKSVHHIKPYRLFNGDWESANQLNNLITLCPSCHSKIEHNMITCPKPKKS